MTIQSLALRIRAVRMLTDGRQHSPQALRWAEMYSRRTTRQSVASLQRAGFSLAEISLGTGEVHR